MLFLQYPPCSTCQKAKKWLDERGIVYTTRHIKEDNPTADELRAWIAASGLPIKRFFNPGGYGIRPCLAVAAHCGRIMLALHPLHNKIF